MEFGLYSFAELTADPFTGNTVSSRQRTSDLLEEIVLADEVGIDVYGLGEHHRPDYVSSAPPVILAAAAPLTKRITFTSAVTVLSSEDPIRVFQQYATLDLISNGRSRIMAGRGSFIESFPLFGYELDDYNELFEEKLLMLLAVRANRENFTWPGTDHTYAVNDKGVYPAPVQHPLPVHVAVGGTPDSVVRAARLGLPLDIAIIGGRPERFAPLVELYWRTARSYDQDLDAMSVGINSHGWIAASHEEAFEEAYPYHEITMNRIGKERGWPPMTRDHFANEAEPHGALVLGSVQQVIEKILYEHELFGMDRFGLQLTVATMPHHKVMKAIELYGSEVIPAVKKALAQEP
jgi:probable LLM family oxidoreductase